VRFGLAPAESQRTGNGGVAVFAGETEGYRLCTFTAFHLARTAISA